MSKKAQQSQVTRGELVKAARQLFAERGFAETSTSEIARMAGVTRGALYHQFADKVALFQAVYEDVEEDIGTLVMAAIGVAADPLDAMRRGCNAYLDACLDPSIRRIVLQEAPSVLGWARKREIDQSHGLGLVRDGLSSIMEAGLMPALPIESLAHVLLGGLNEAAMMLAHSEDPKATRIEAGAAVIAVFDALARSSCAD